MDFLEARRLASQLLQCLRMCPNPYRNQGEHQIHRSIGLRARLTPNSTRRRQTSLDSLTPHAVAQ